MHTEVAANCPSSANRHLQGITRPPCIPILEAESLNRSSVVRPSNGGTTNKSPSFSLAGNAIRRHSNRDAAVRDALPVSRIKHPSCTL